MPASLNYFAASNARFEVGLQVGDVLDADRQPDEAIDDAELLAASRRARSRAS